MTLYQFNILTEDNKLKTVWEEGVFIENKPADIGGIKYFSLYGIVGCNTPY